MDLDKDEQKILKKAFAKNNTNNKSLIFVRVFEIIFIVAIFALMMKNAPILIAMIIVFVAPFVLLWLFFVSMRCVNKKFAKSQKSKVVLRIVILAMVVLYFAQPAITRIYANRTISELGTPTKDDIAKWQKEIERNMYRSSKYQPYAVINAHRISDDGNWTISDTITRSFNTAQITRQAYWRSRISWLFLYNFEIFKRFEYFRKPSFTKDLGSFNINEVNKKIILEYR